VFLKMAFLGYDRIESSGVYRKSRRNCDCLCSGGQTPLGMNLALNVLYVLNIQFCAFLVTEILDAFYAFSAFRFTDHVVPFWVQHDQ
jgi:hypothetical protein